MFWPGAMNRMSMYKQGRIIKSQDVALVTTTANTPTDFTPFGVQEKDDPPASISRSREREQIIQALTPRIAAAEKQGYEQGFAEGFREGSNVQKNEALAAVNALQAVREEVGSFKGKILQSTEKQILELCIAVAEKILHQEISTDRRVIQSVLKAAFRTLVDRENVKIRLNAEDFRYLAEMKSDFIRSLDGVRNVFFEEDGSIPRGGAILETSSGEVDARIGEQLAEVKAAMDLSLS